MPFSARQTTLVPTTPTNLLPRGDGTGFTFKNTQGHTSDPLPVSIKNEDPSATLWIGGPDVSDATGQSYAPGEVFVANLYGADMPFGFSVTACLVSVLAGRQ